MKKGNSFWLSYADLMTSLFFVMLVLYALTFVKLKAERETYRLQAEQFKKIQALQKAIEDIDPTDKYFEYNEEYKKHILKLQVQFGKGSANIQKLPTSTKRELVEAGKKIQTLVNNYKDEKNIRYLVLIEGQASLDSYSRNFELSYERALSLLEFWEANHVNLRKLENCELILSGSGTGGVPRDKNEDKNQRFLIQIIPKIGTL
jgi:outer membrane protein OmpA-like peptidoglycan-associated protein